MTKRLLLIFIIAMLAACEQERERVDDAVLVRSEAVKRADFTPSLALLGVVRPGRSVPIVAVTSGRIHYPQRFSSGLQTGVVVHANETLATIDNDRLASAVTQARLQMEAADADFERGRRSYEQGVLSERDYSTIRLRSQLAHETYDASRRDSAQATLTATASGSLVVNKVIAPGSQIAEGTTLGEIATGSMPVIEASVAASDRELLRVGQPITFANGTGRISEVASSIDPSGTARVVAVITGGTPPPSGTGVTMQVVLDHHPDTITVPDESVVALPDGPGVYVEGAGEGMYRRFRAKSVRVQTGRRANGRIEILSGLREGDRVVIAGADALTDGAPISEGEKK